MVNCNVITYSRLLEVLNYDPITGLFYWRNNIGKRFKAGQKAGSLNIQNNYIEIGIDGISYRAHRLAYFYMTQEWPSPSCDHVNGIKHDNRWINLRQATVGQNGANSAPRRGVKYKGAYLNARKNKWFSQITVNGKSIRLGTFDNPEAAHKAYCKAAKKYHGEFARTV